MHQSGERDGVWELSTAVSPLCNTAATSGASSDRVGIEARVAHTVPGVAEVRSVRLMCRIDTRSRRQMGIDIYTLTQRITPYDSRRTRVTDGSAINSERLASQHMAQEDGQERDSAAHAMRAIVSTMQRRLLVSFTHAGLSWLLRIGLRLLGLRVGSGLRGMPGVI